MQGADLRIVVRCKGETCAVQCWMPPPDNLRHGTGALVIKAIVPDWKQGVKAYPPKHKSSSTLGPQKITVFISLTEHEDGQAFPFLYLDRGQSRDVYAGSPPLGPAVLKIHSTGWNNNLTEADLSSRKDISFSAVLFGMLLLYESRGGASTLERRAGW